MKFSASIKKKRKSASKDKLDANYENELGLKQLTLSIKRIAYKILKRNSLLMGSMSTSATLPRLKQLTLIAVSVLNLRIVRD